MRWITVRDGRAGRGGPHHDYGQLHRLALTHTTATSSWIEDNERLAKTMERTVIRRPGQMLDVANMALFLASDASNWITGQTYPVNGGFSFAL